VGFSKTIVRRNLSRAFILTPGRMDGRHTLTITSIKFSSYLWWQEIILSNSRPPGHILQGNCQNTLLEYWYVCFCYGMGNSEANELRYDELNSNSVKSEQSTGAPMEMGARRLRAVRRTRGLD